MFRERICGTMHVDKRSEQDNRKAEEYKYQMTIKIKRNKCSAHGSFILDDGVDALGNTVIPINLTQVHD